MSVLLHFSSFGHQLLAKIIEAFFLGLVERRVGVVIVREHVRPIMHRHDVRISTTLQQFKGNLSMASLTGQVEGSYIPAHVAS